MKRTRNTMILALAALLVCAGSVQAQRDPAPTVRAQVPQLNHTSASIVPQGFSFPILGVDEDHQGREPLKYRYLLVEAEVNGQWLTSAYHYEAYGRQLVAFDQEGWSHWFDRSFTARALLFS